MKVLFSEVGLQFNKLLNTEVEESKGSFKSHIIQAAIKETSSLKNSNNDLATFKTSRLIDSTLSLLKAQQDNVPSSKIYVTSIEKLPQRIVEKFIGLKKDVPKLIITEIIDHPNPLFGNPIPVFSAPDINLETIKKNPIIKWEKDVEPLILEKEDYSEIKEKEIPFQSVVEPDKIEIPKEAKTEIKSGITEEKGQIVDVKPETKDVGAKVDVTRIETQPISVVGNPEVVVTKPDVNQRLVKEAKAEIKSGITEEKGQIVDVKPETKDVGAKV
ncbi:MAG: hypothetical protein AB1567_10820, partial [bacterium]